MQDLEFASDIVQKLNTILVTSPELAEFRKRLKSVETRVRGSSSSWLRLIGSRSPARRTGVVHHTLPVMVSQCSICILTMSISAGV